jgi:[pyruvate, water dikinase]-phosphate phosphotransferase / [pyruvate, water dikinase] kinase
MKTQRSHRIRPVGRTGSPTRRPSPQAFAVNEVSKKLRQPLVVVNMSGGTGRTADQVLKAALAQFDNPPVRIVQLAHLRNQRRARKEVQKAAEEHAIIVHTLVSPQIREAVVQEAERQLVPTVDVLGPVINALADGLQAKPASQPGLSYKLQKEQFDRIDSVDFTLAHDDGARLATLGESDVVLVGVSRVAKSVTCFYLAYRGVRAANVPIVLNSEVPAELERFDSRRVVGLTMNPERLLALRAARLAGMGYGNIEDYVDRNQILDELRYASDLMRRHHWICIDVSYLSVEEVATKVLRYIEGSLCRRHAPP